MFNNYKLLMTYIHCILMKNEQIYYIIYNIIQLLQFTIQYYV